MDEIKIPKNVLNFFVGLAAVVALILILEMTMDLGIWNVLIVTAFLFILNYFWVLPFARHLSKSIPQLASSPEKPDDPGTTAYVAADILILGLFGFMVALLTNAFFWAFSWRPRDWPGCLAFMVMSFTGVLLLGPMNNSTSVGNGCSVGVGEDCSNLNNYTDIVNCYSQRALETDNVSECDQMNENNGQFVATLSNEMWQHDLSHYPNFTLSYAIESSRALCYGGISAHRINLSLCMDNFKDTSRAVCFFRYVTLTDNVSACLHLNEPAERFSCYVLSSIWKNDSTYCNGLPDESERVFCYVEFGKEQNDSSVCNRLLNPYDRSKCRALQNNSD